MAFPVIPTQAAGRVLWGTQADTTATRTFPTLTGLTKNPGDLLIAIIVAYQTGTGTDAAFSGWTGGFTEFHDSATTTTMAMGAAYKWSDGTETGTFAVTQAGAITGHAAMLVLSISGAHPSTPPAAGSRASSTAGTSNPASFDPAGWAAEDTLWIAVGGQGETSTAAAWTGFSGAAPTNFSDWWGSAQSADVVGGVQAAVAFRQQNAASQDVASFPMDTSNVRDGAFVIAVRPGIVKTGIGISPNVASGTKNIVKGKTGAGVTGAIGGAALQYVGSSAGATQANPISNSSLTVASGVQANDLIVVQVLNNGTGTGAAVGGSSQTNVKNIAGTPDALTDLGYFPVGTAPTAKQRVYLGRAIATASTTVSLTSDSSDDLYWFWHYFRNVATGSTVSAVLENISAGNVEFLAGDTTSVFQIEIYTNGPGRLALNLIGFSGFVEAPPVSFTGEEGGDFIEEAQYLGSGATLDLQVASLGTSTAIFGGSVTVGEVWGNVGFALIPGAVGAEGFTGGGVAVKTSGAAQYIKAGTAYIGRTTTTKLPTSGTSVSSGTAWTNPGRITADDASDASVSVTSFTNSQKIYGSQYGFAVTGTVRGIEVLVNGLSISAASALSRLSKTGGTSDGSNVSITNANPVGGSSTHLWGTTWTAAEVNASTFGAMVYVGGGPDAETASADALYVTVYTGEGLTGGGVSEKTTVGGGGTEYVKAGIAISNDSGGFTGIGAGAVTFVEAGVGQAEGKAFGVAQKVIGVTYTKTGIATISGGYPYEILLDNPVSYWRLGDTASPMVDAKGVHNGTATGTTTLGATGLLTGDADKAISMTGAVGQGVDVGNHAEYQLGTLTVEAWIKTSVNDGIYRTIIAKQFAYGVFVRAGVLTIYEWVSSTTVTRGGSIVDDVPHHIVVTFQEDGSSVAYIDGAAAGATWTHDTSNQSTALQIGTNTGGNQEFNGTLDEAAIYSTVLSPARVQAHYLAGTGDGGSGLIASGTAIKTSGAQYAKIGNGILDGSGTGASAPTYSETGIGISQRVGEGAGANTFTESGTGISLRAGEGAGAITFVQANLAITAWIVTGPADVTFVETGTASSERTGAGADANTFAETSAGVSERKTSGPSEFLGEAGDRAVVLYWVEVEVPLAAGAGTINVKSGAAVADFVGAGADALTVTETGTTVAPFTGTGDGRDQQSNKETAISTFSASGADAATRNRTGTAVSGFSASGVDVTTYAQQNAAVSPFVGSGDAATTFAEAGTGIAPFSASGVVTKTINKIGTGVGARTGSGADVVTFTEAGTVFTDRLASGATDVAAVKLGTATKEHVASGTDATTFVETGSGVLVRVASGVAAKTRSKSGTAVTIFVASGADACTSAEAGLGVSLRTASGADVFTAVEAGTGVAPFSSSGTRARELPRTGIAASELRAFGARAIDHLRTGTVAADFTGAAASAITYVEAGTGITERKTSGSISVTGDKRGSGIAVFTGSGDGRVTLSRTGAAISARVASGTDATTFNRRGQATLDNLIGGSLDTSFERRETGTGVLVAVATGAKSITRAKTGTAAAVFSASGVRSVAFGEAGTGITERKASGVSAAQYGTTYTKTGTAASDFAGTGAGAWAVAETGAGISERVAAGTKSKTASKTGAGIITFSASGVAPSDKSKSGSAVAAFVASASAAWTISDTGAAISVRVASGADAVTFTESGSAVSARVASGADSITFSEAAIAVAPFTGSADGRVTFAKTGTGVLVRTGTAAATWTVNRTGTGISGRIGGGDGDKIGEPTGAAAVGFTGTGSATWTLTRTGAGVSAKVTVGAGEWTTVEAGTARAPFDGTAARAIEHIRSGSAVLGLFARGDAVSTLNRRGTAISDRHVRVVEVDVVNKSGFAVAPFSAAGGKSQTGDKFGTAVAAFTAFCTRLAEKPRTGTGVIGLTGSGDGRAVFDQAGLAITGFVARGADVAVHTESGTSYIEFTGSFSPAYEVQKNGSAILWFVGSGTRFLLTGVFLGPMSATVIPRPGATASVNLFTSSTVSVRQAPVGAVFVSMSTPTTAVSSKSRLRVSVKKVSPL